MSDARFPWFRSWSVAFVVALLAVCPRIGWSTTTHQPNYTPSVVGAVVDNPMFDGVANTMMYTVTVTVDDTFDNMRHRAEIGFTSRGTGPGGNPATSCPASTEYTWSSATHVFDADDTWTWTLYNLQPGTAYFYTVRTGTSANYKYSCGALATPAAPTPTVPSTLAALNLSVDNSSAAYATKYVMFDTDDCDGENHLVTVDADTGNIVWYLDIPAVTGIPGAEIGGWRFQPAGDGYLTSDRILATLSAHQHREYLYELELDGTVVAFKDFGLLDTAEDGHLCDGSDNRSAGPCPHHDAFKSDSTGQTYVLTSANSFISTVGNPTWTRGRCTDPTPYRFIGDGYQTLSEDYSTFVDTSLIDDLGYDPAGTLPGPSAPAGCATSLGWRRTLSPLFNWIDWIHTNSLAGTADGIYLDLSLKEFDQIIRVRADGTSASPEWRLASDPAYSDFGTLALGPNVATGAAVFAGQHDVHSVDDTTLLLFDNQGNVDAISGNKEARVLSITFDTTTWSAQIDRSWALVENDTTKPATLDCPTKGSGQVIPGGGTDRVLALCHEDFAIEELDDPTGFPSPPVLYVGIPDPPAEVCGGTDASSRVGITGWYRAYPLESLGDF